MRPAAFVYDGHRILQMRKNARLRLVRWGRAIKFEPFRVINHSERGLRLTFHLELTWNPQSLSAILLYIHFIRLFSKFAFLALGGLVA